MTAVADPERDSVVEGKHVLMALLGFFAIIVIANGIFITYAVRSFPGEQEEKSYLQGLNFNETLDELAAQATLGWSVSVEEARLDEAGGVITLMFRDRKGAPLRGLHLEGRIGRPAYDGYDAVLDFQPLGDGRYSAQMAAFSQGQWLLTGEATGRDRDRFSFQSRLLID